jgi:hypothetical protein
MIRSTPTRTIVWFRLASDSAKKIEWELSEYLAYAKAAATEEQFRRGGLLGGKVSYLTAKDLEELGGEGIIHKRVRTKGAG